MIMNSDKCGNTTSYDTLNASQLSLYMTYEWRKCPMLQLQGVVELCGRLYLSDRSSAVHVSGSGWGSWYLYAQLRPARPAPVSRFELTSCCRPTQSGVSHRTKHRSSTSVQLRTVEQDSVVLSVRHKPMKCRRTLYSSSKRNSEVIILQKVGFCTIITELRIPFKLPESVLVLGY